MSGPEATREQINAGMESSQTDALELAALERHLLDALRHVDAPDGFADRVVALTQPAGHAPRTWRRLLQLPRWQLAVGGALAASVLAGSLATEAVHERRKQERALANRQFEVTTRVTNEALARTREQLERAGVFRED